mgnify:CR=1 FL=1
MFLKLSLVSLLFVASCTKVPPGYVGIAVNNYGTQKGVEDFPLLTGMFWYNPFTTDIYTFPTFLQNHVWTQNPKEGSPDDDSITFNSIEGATVNADVAISYVFEGKKVPHIFVEFRQDVKHITNVYIRSKVRDSFARHASQIKITEIFGMRKQDLLVAVKEDLNAELVKKGIQFDMVSFVGALRVDDKVMNSINATIEATQKAIEAENLVRQTEAQARSRVANARGEADAITAMANAQAEANIIVAKSLTPELVQWQAVQKWNGITPMVTGTTTPFIQIPTGR